MNGSPEYTPNSESPRRSLSRTAGRFCLLAGVLAGLGAGWLLLPRCLYSSQHQPLTFSHDIHVAGQEMACDECHFLRDDGSFSGLPAIDACAGCHEEAMTESPGEALLVAYVAEGRPIPWLAYARQPENVFFPHAPHLELAQIECRRCHGDHGESDTLPALEINRISTYSRNIWGPRIQGGGPDPWNSMKMSDCVDCHAEQNVQDHCLMCHK